MASAVSWSVPAGKAGQLLGGAKAAALASMSGSDIGSNPQLSPPSIIRPASKPARRPGLVRVAIAEVIGHLFAGI
jgi:hypothetical protein